MPAGPPYCSMQGMNEPGRPAQQLPGSPGIVFCSAASSAPEEDNNYRCFLSQVNGWCCLVSSAYIIASAKGISTQLLDLPSQRFQSWPIPSAYCGQPRSSPVVAE